MDIATLLATLEFSRARLLGILNTIEKSGHDVQTVLAWRPGPGRAHIGWQAMHCAATHDRYVNVRLKGGSAKDELLVTHFGGGSIPSDTNVPTLSDIRVALDTHYTAFKAYVTTLTPNDLKRTQEGPPGVHRSVAESIILLGWHEAHHQGQIHLTWNLYKVAHATA